MRYFKKRSFEKVDRGYFTFQRVTEVCASEFPPPGGEEITFGEYCMLRRAFEGNEGRYLASSILEDTYHREDFDNDPLYDKERSKAFEEGE